MLICINHMNYVVAILILFRASLSMRTVQYFHKCDIKGASYS